MNVLIVGGTGLIGSALAKYFCSENISFSYTVRQNKDKNPHCIEYSLVKASLKPLIWLHIY